MTGGSMQVAIGTEVVTVIRLKSRDPEGREVWGWSIHGPAVNADGEDLHSGASGVGGGPLRMMGTLLSFLGAAAEAYHAQMAVKTYVPENINLFVHEVREWAYLNQNELAMAVIEIEESPCEGAPVLEHLPGRVLRSTCPKCGEVGTYPDTTSGAIP